MLKGQLVWERPRLVLCTLLHWALMFWGGFSTCTCCLDVIFCLPLAQAREPRTKKGRKLAHAGKQLEACPCTHTESKQAAAQCSGCSVSKGFVSQRGPADRMGLGERFP